MNAQGKRFTKTNQQMLSKRFYVANGFATELLRVDCLREATGMMHLLSDEMIELFLENN